MFKLTGRNWPPTHPGLRQTRTTLGSFCPSPSVSIEVLPEESPGITLHVYKFSRQDPSQQPGRCRQGHAHWKFLGFFLCCFHWPFHRATDLSHKSCLLTSDFGRPSAATTWSSTVSRPAWTQQQCSQHTVPLANYPSHSLATLPVSGATELLFQLDWYCPSQRWAAPSRCATCSS